MDIDTRSVYIGSIPFDYTEEQVAEIARSVGPVSNLTLLFDQLTGKSKGYAYVRYNDHETAASAVRNLNNMGIGNRFLKCLFSSDTLLFEDTTSTAIHAKLPPLPLGVQLKLNQSTQEAISKALSALTQDSAAKVLAEAQQMSLENPTLMKRLLDQSPQLAHALADAAIMVGLCTSDVVQLCVNRHQPKVDTITLQHAQLLQDVKKLTDDDMAALSDDQRRVVGDVQEEISKGTYGIV